MYPQNNYSYYQPTTPTNQMRYQQPSLVLKGRPVSSIEEAKAMSIDFDGSIFYFPDLANKRIYTKQINLDGTATLKMYEQTEIPAPAPVESIYVTKEDFNIAFGELRELILAATAKSEQPPVPEKQVF